MSATEPTGALAHAVDQYLETLELEEARELPPEAPSLQDRRAELNRAFWQVARECVHKAIPKDVNGELRLDEVTRELLDYGLFGHEALGDARRALLTKVEGHDVLLLTDSLREVYDDVLRRDLLDELKQDLDLLCQDIELWPETQLRHVRYRDERVRRLLGDSPKTSHVLKLFAEIDEKLEAYQRLGKLVRQGSATPEDRKAWGTIRHYVDSRRDQVGEILSPLTREDDPARAATAAEALAAAEAVDASYGHLNDLHARRRAVEQEVMEQQRAAGRITRIEIERALFRELDAVAGLTRLGSRYGRVDECAVPVDRDVEWINREGAREACQHVVEFDPLIFDNALAERFGLPDVLLAPGIGDGVFDASRNRWVIPQRCTGGAVASFAHAAILYRLDVDDARALLHSYRAEVPAARGVRSNLKLRTLLIRDYIAWMCGETFGEETLGRATREWFEAHVAPRKDEPWIPPEYRGLGEPALKAELKQLGESPDELYRGAVIRWMLAPGDAVTLKEQALPLIRKAAQAEPENKAILYSHGVFSMKAGDFQRAIDSFRKFASLAGRSWWSSKAVELCAKCR